MWQSVVCRQPSALPCGRAHAVLRRGVLVGATQTEHAERYFTCRRCGAHGEVAFAARGESRWHRSSLFDGGAAEDNARADAQHDMMVDAERVTALIRCPTCGKRDAGYVWWSWIRPLALFAFAGVLYVLLPMYQVLIGVGIAALFQTYREYMRYRRADRATILRLQSGKLPEPKPRPPLTPVAPPVPKLPAARALVAPPVPTRAPRGPADEPAFLRDKS